ncbi:MAG TPA: hypothetical protein VM618_04290 [Acidimicrobiia bacterium]|nr:hypothetical protein [Acidimicrobiia bacterium]
MRHLRVPVEVRSRYQDGAWSRGFEIEEVVRVRDDREAYRLRRRSDGVVLPVLFDADEVRQLDDRP